MRRGRSPIADFFNNFNAAYDTTAKVGRDIEVANAVNAKPTESQAYTEEQGKELEGLAAQGYKIDFDQTKNAYVASNEAGDAKTMAMQGLTTNFMGKQFDGSAEANKERIDQLRSTAVAEVLSRYDPERSMAVRRQVQPVERDASVRARDAGPGPLDDGLGRIEGELRQRFQASLVDHSGQPREATVDDHLAHSQRRVTSLAQAGYFKEADQVTRDAMAQSYIKIQRDTPSRRDAAAKAAAAMAEGDYAPLRDLYNGYVPSGIRISSIEAGQGGALHIKRADLDGRALPAVTLRDREEALGMLKSIDDPRNLYQYSQSEFERSLRPGRSVGTGGPMLEPSR
ncbi:MULTISPECIES: hypothetical protein [Pseudomonadota]|uniref:hypothetical protein n=1 Tax=Pseudomonadota TaxID=1224 RepID=UPI000773395C|nr:MULTISPECIES: hypothetical protein [Pseudomonadota]MPT02568.1 hypothetical protein [Pseudomonas sp.]MPT51336.1 hypothetical protein [Delftia sp.]SFB51983.1 hypothetical protein SAMN05444579_1085 [Delftia tsuruhatensis]